MNPRISLNGHPAPAPSLEDRKKSLMSNLQGEYARTTDGWGVEIDWLLDIGTCVGAEVDVWTEDSGRFTEMLAWRRFDGKWTVCVGTRDNCFEDLNRGPEVIEWKPVLECTMLSKISLLKEVEKLKAAVISAGEKFVSERNEWWDNQPF